MRRPNRIYLDTNIFITFVEQSHELSEMLRRLVKSAPEAAKPYFVTSELTLSELMVKPCRDGNERLIEHYKRMITASKWLDVAPVDRSALYNAAILRAEYSHLKLPDAIHVSTAIGRECSHFLTADRGIRSSYMLPRNYLRLEILQSDEPTLTFLLENLAE